MAQNPIRSGDSSPTEAMTTLGSPYLEFINQSFSTDQDLSLPDRVISNPVLQNTNLSDSNNSATHSPSPRERILNKLYKRGSKETLRSGTSSTSSSKNPTALQASSSSTRYSNSDGGSSSTLSSPAIPKSILKQNNSRTPTTVNNPLPTLPTPTAFQQQQQQQPQRERQLHSSSQLQPTSTTAYQTSTPIMTPSSLQAPLQSQNNHLEPHTAGNNYVQPPPTQQAPPPSSNTFSIAGLVRAASPFALRPASPGSFEGGRDTNTNSYTSTHRSSRNLSNGTDPTYNVTQTDMTLDALAQRWQAYQAMMKKSYREDPFYRRWTKSKWILLLSTTLLLIYSCTGLVVTIGYMSHRFLYAAIMMEFHSNLILLAFAGSVVGIACAILGFLGIFRENRTLLTIYSTLLWVVFALYVSVGYIAFRREKNHLNQHLRDEWIHSYSRGQRLLVQRQMKCCGFLGPNSYGEYDLRCFPMINLPGCQFKYREYERELLSTSWTASFSIIPFQLLVMIVALLCSNHVDGMLRSARPGLKSFKEEKKE